jgi:hypothetical protein
LIEYNFGNKEFILPEKGNKELQPLVAVSREFEASKAKCLKEIAQNSLKLSMKLLPLVIAKIIT